MILVPLVGLLFGGQGLSPVGRLFQTGLTRIFNYAVSKNLAFFDTAELYGIGRSETLIGNFRKEAGVDGEKVQIATKFAALPFRTKSDNVVKACRASLKRLNPDGTDKPIDLYQIHMPDSKL